mmetsp:Transcript_10539/g.12975  ORF Transcript_10539/g.12975 Transcript_10539/m.12975 type:complete len:149 (-) Transcript_10539:25-471(-)|eukprot:CAMPEP_0172502334 /NCGR_PEP_ID=MMETSP1066-20121228/158887_1 /TAXON_ID=671091 /ORGANISM="Coscinodiscus wailesii, Strain CCMP2513" /LENGTH=148 /DNA_ID=CAMNT_0013277547 /DNA_START=158 /DNA_END=604 /DNA_ORIENTATION=+
MPLIGIPNTISADLLYALAKAGHGDKIVIADSNFPSDAIASTAIVKAPIRVNATAPDILRDILKLLPLDQYKPDGQPLAVMDRIPVHKEVDLDVPAYKGFADVTGRGVEDMEYIERFAFYEAAKESFVVIQTTDTTPYANAIIWKGCV